MAMLGQILSDLAQVDTWLDEYVDYWYKSQPLAQDWARISKIGEELGEVIQAFILHTGQNPRKGKGENMDAVLGELTDVIYTAMLAMLHFTKDPAMVGRYMADGNRKISARMMEDKRLRARQRVAPSQRALAAQGDWARRMRGDVADIGHIDMGDPDGMVDNS